MDRQIYRYTFVEGIAHEDIESALLLAVLATENQHGEPQTRLDAAHLFDKAQGTCVIDAGTPVGMDLNRHFLGFLGREFGPDAFAVQHVDRFPTSPLNNGRFSR